MAVVASSVSCVAKMPATSRPAAPSSGWNPSLRRSTHAICLHEVPFPAGQDATSSDAKVLQIQSLRLPCDFPLNLNLTCVNVSFHGVSLLSKKGQEKLTQLQVIETAGCKRSCAPPKPRPIIPKSQVSTRPRSPESGLDNPPSLSFKAKRM